jgi:hypothetical protein
MNKYQTREHDTKIDVRFPEGVYGAIELIATVDEAKIHHISNKRVLTPTVIKLVKLGISQLIAQYPDKYPINLSDTGLSDTNSIDLSDNALTRLTTVEAEVESLKKLIEGLSDKSDDTSRIHIQSDTIDDTSRIHIQSDTIDDTSRIHIQSDTIDDTSRIHIQSDIVDDTSRIVETSDSIATPTIEIVTGDIPDPRLKTWKEFFDMVGIVALKATEAQKKENIDIRTKQIEAGVLAAKDKGLGEWAVKVAGRSFVRVGNT